MEMRELCWKHLMWISGAAARTKGRWDRNDTRGTEKSIMDNWVVGLGAMCCPMEGGGEEPRRLRGQTGSSCRVWAGNENNSGPSHGG